MRAWRLAVLLAAAAALCGCGDSSPEAKALRSNLDALSQADVQSRIVAANELGRMRATNAVPRLILASDDIRPDVRMAVVEALVQIGDPRAAEVFCRHLKSREWRTRQLAAQGLGRLGSASAAPHLREAMRDEQVAVSTAAAVALSACVGPDLLKAIAESGDEPVGAREAALLVLGESGAAGIEAVSAAARDTNAAVRAAAFAALARSGGAKEAALLVDGLLDPAPSVRKSSEKALLAMEPDAALPALTAALDGGTVERQMAILRMVEGDRTVRGLGVLAAVLVSDSATVRSRAERILADRKQQLARARQDTRMLPVDVLMRALSSTSEAVRAAAILHIEQDAVVNRSIEPKLHAATKDASPAVRVVAVRLLTRLSPEGLVGSLTPLLCDADAEVRLAAAMPLASSTNEAAVAIVVDSLQKEVAAYRTASGEKAGRDRAGRIATLVEVLRSSGSGKGVPVLLTCLDINDLDVLPAVIRALGVTGDRTVYDRVTPFLARATWGEQGIRSAAIEAMAALDPARAADALVPLLSVSNKWQAESCLVTLCRVLAKMKEPRAAEHMIDRLRDRYDKESGRMNEVKLAAAAGLVELGEHAVPTIVRRLNDTKVREGALSMILGRIGEPAAKPTVAALKNEDALIRKNAAWALGYLAARPDVVEGLAAALADGDVDVRAAAAWALGHLQAKEASAGLRIMLGSEHAKDRLAAAEAMGRLGDVSASQLLIGKLRDPDPDVRFAVVTALGALGDKSAIEPLRAFVAEEKEERIRFAAGESLTALGVNAVTVKGR
jgi:HEAT repeat protein